MSNNSSPCKAPERILAGIEFGFYALQQPMEKRVVGAVRSSISTKGDLLAGPVTALPTNHSAKGVLLNDYLIALASICFRGRKFGNSPRLAETSATVHADTIIRQIDTREIPMSLLKKSRIGFLGFVAMFALLLTSGCKSEYRFDAATKESLEAEIDELCKKPDANSEKLRQAADVLRIFYLTQSTNLLTRDQEMLEKFRGKTPQQVMDEFDKLNDATKKTVSQQATVMRKEISSLDAKGNLMGIGLALHRFEEKHRCYPAAASMDSNGKRLLSWRVHILPFITLDDGTDTESLYREFHLDEPWDSEHNKKLIPKMPSLYSSKDDSELIPQGKTRYLVPIGSGTLFEANGTSDENALKGWRIRDIRDGVTNTIMVVEASHETAVIWTKPEDLNVDSSNPFKGLGAGSKGEFKVLLATASVSQLDKHFAPESLNALFTRNGGEAFEFRGF